MFLGEAEFYRTKGAKDKKKRKSSPTRNILASGGAGATGLAGGVWTTGEAMKAIPGLKKIGTKISQTGPGYAALSGLVGGASVAAIREALKKRRKTKRKEYAK